MHKDELLVVVPAFNEEASIRDVIAEILSSGYDVLVVDDGSSDSTSTCATEAGALVLSFPFNVGVGKALRAGFRFAIDHGYEYVVQVDGDGQHPVRQIKDLQAAATQYGAHLVVGSRFISAESTLTTPLPMRILMRILAAFVSRATKSKITDATSGFRIISQPLLGECERCLPDYYLGETFEALILAGRAGYVVREIPAALSQRKYGVSSASRP